MNDPWHQETLDGLVAYLGLVNRSAIAVVVTSSPELETAVVAELGSRLGAERRIVTLDLATPGSESWAFVSVVRSAISPGLLTLVRGLPALLRRETELKPKEVPETLRYLNFNRELFDRPGEGFAFFVDGPSATALAKRAPDFNRYTQWFELIDWRDVVATFAQPSPAASPGGKDWGQEEAWQAARLKDLASCSNLPEEQASALLGHADSLMHLDRLDDARRELLAAEQLVAAEPFTETRVDVLSLLAVVELRAASPNRATEALDRAERLAYSAGRLRSQSQVVMLRALVSNARGLPAAAIEEARHTLELQQTMGDRLDLPLTQAVASGALLALGRIREAEDQARAGIAAAKAVGNAPAELAGLHALAGAAAAQGQLNAAFALLGQATSLARGTNDSFALSNVVSLIALALLQGGSPTNASAALRPVFQRAQQHGPPLLAVTTAAFLLVVEWPLGRRRILKEIAASALSQVEAGGLHALRPTLLIHLGLLAELEGALGPASDLLRQAEQEAELHARAAELAQARLHLGRQLWQLGNTTAGENKIRAALEQSLEAGARIAEAQASSALAFLCVASGRNSEGKTLAQKALASVRETRALFHQPEALAALASCERASGHHQAADSLEQRWRDLVRGMEAPDLETLVERSTTHALRFATAPAA